jgi:hypothetical protein
MNWRFLRGIIGTTLTWAGAGAVGGLALGVIQVVWLGLRDTPWSLAFRFGTNAIGFWALIGAVLGLLFAVALPIAARRVSSLGALLARRVAASGAVSGVLVALGLLAVVMGGAMPPLIALALYVGVGALLGASVAAGMLRVAQRIPLVTAARATRLQPPAVERVVGADEAAQRSVPAAEITGAAS